MESRNKKNTHGSQGEPVTYWDYLHLDRLLDLQGGLAGDDEQLLADELHFIVVHQVFELWFKQVIRELYLARDKMAVPRVDEKIIPFVVHHLNRVNTILGLAVNHFEVMETLLPQDFLQFRSKLGTASGFQSFQVREIELILGLEQSEREAQGHGNPLALLLKAAKGSAQGETIIQRLKKAGAGPSLHQSLNTWLYRTPIQGSMPGDAGDESAVQTFVTQYLAGIKKQNEQQLEQLVRDGSDETVIGERFEAIVRQVREFLFAEDVEEEQRQRVSRIRAGILFIESYRELPLLAWPRLLLDTIVQLEEHLIGFRFRHARMVERVIGRRVGTGGSPGVDYLDQTVQYRIFKELWTVRTLLLPADYRPPVETPSLYGFSMVSRD
jgi:tryptophan 2,3-dioxygenase